MLKPVERVHCDRRIGIRDADGLEGRSDLLSLGLPVGLNYRKPSGLDNGSHLFTPGAIHRGSLLSITPPGRRGKSAAAIRAGGVDFEMSLAQRLSRVWIS